VAPVLIRDDATYGVDGGFLDEDGKSDTKLSASPDAITGDVRAYANRSQHRPFPSFRCTFRVEHELHTTGRRPRFYISAPYILSKLKGCEGWRRP